MVWINRNMPCLECSSSDAMQESEHHFQCFSCNKTFKKRDFQKDACFSVRERTHGEKMQKKEDLVTCEFYEIKSRGITKDTALKYKIGALKYSGVFGSGDKKEYVNNEWTYIFNRVTDSSVTSQKLRVFCDKEKMKILGDDKKKTLYGSWLFEPKNTHFCVITEGEFDAAVVYQETGIAAVSINAGAGSALSEIKNNIDWLSRWQYIVLCFDEDKPGQDAVKKILDEPNLFDPGKVRLARLSYKDANEMLLEGKSADLKKAIWNASTFSPPDIFSLDDCLEEALEEPTEGIKIIWPSLHAAAMGYQPNSIIVVGAADGIGKSEAADEMIHGIISKEKESVFIFSAEKSKGQLAKAQAGKILNLPLHIPGTPFDKEKIKEAIQGLENRMRVWKPNTSVTIDTIIAKMKYAAMVYNTKVFVIDHLKALEAYFSDINKEMNKLFAELKSFVDVYKATVIVLSHVRKGDSGEQSFKAGRPPTTEDLHGSGAIAAWADLILLLSRNTVSDDEFERRVMRVDITKKRLMGGRGINKFYLLYDNDTGRLNELDYSEYEASKDEKI